MIMVCVVLECFVCVAILNANQFNRQLKFPTNYTNAKKSKSNSPAIEVLESLLVLHKPI